MPHAQVATDRLTQIAYLAQRVILNLRALAAKPVRWVIL